MDDDEDDYLITQDLVQDIKHQRYRIDWASSYDEGWKRLQSQEYDVYLVDFRLGANTGLDLIRAARNLEKPSPIILLTGQGDFETDAQAMRLGAADYLIKNQLSADVLERAIRYAIQQARNLNQIRTLNTELEDRVTRRTQALRQAVSDLRQSQQLFRSIAKNFPNGAIMVMDTELKFVFVDGMELPKIGFQSQDLIGRKMGDLFPPEVRSELEENLQQVLLGETRQFELPYHSAIYLWQAVPLSDQEGNLNQVLMVSKNVTRERKAEHEIRNALTKERQLNELKTRFVSMASHEFRTPLSTILSSISLIERYQNTEQQPKREKHIDRIKSSVRNLTNILEDFLSITRLEEGHIEVRPEWFQVLDFVTLVVEDMHGLLKDGQQIQIDGSSSIKVYLDKHLVRNILNNLLSNAIKYSERNTIVELRFSLSDGMLCIAVEDHGIGIPEDEQKHMFERFFRAANVTNIQGTGLGLNIMQKYVSLLNGKVSFESELNRGTTFYVHFPAEYKAKATPELQE